MTDLICQIQALSKIFIFIGSGHGPFEAFSDNEVVTKLTLTQRLPFATLVPCSNLNQFNRSYHHKQEWPKGHSAMDKAVACHAGGRGSNPGTTKVYSAPILSGPPAMCALSLTMPVITCSSMNICPRRVKRELSWQNPSSAI